MSVLTAVGAALQVTARLGQPSTRRREFPAHDVVDPQIECDHGGHLGLAFLLENSVSQLKCVYGCLRVPGPQGRRSQRRQIVALGKRARRMRLCQHLEGCLPIPSGHRPSPFGDGPRQIRADWCWLRGTARCCGGKFGRCDDPAHDALVRQLQAAVLDLGPDVELVVQAQQVLLHCRLRNKKRFRDLSHRSRLAESRSAHAGAGKLSQHVTFATRQLRCPSDRSLHRAASYAIDFGTSHGRNDGNLRRRRRCDPIPVTRFNVFHENQWRHGSQHV